MTTNYRFLFGSWFTLCIFILSCFSCSESSSEAEWSNISDSGSEVNTLVSDEKGVIFAGRSGDEGVMVSRNNGESWQEMNNGLLHPNVLSLLLTDSNIYIGTNGGGIYRMSYDSEIWNPANEGISDYLIFNIAGSSNKDLFAAGLSNLYRSSNNGLNWIPVVGGIEQSQVYTTAVTESGIIFAGSNYGLHRSADNGESWQALVQGLPATAFAVEALLVEGEMLVLAGSNKGIYRSSNSGSSWILVAAEGDDVRGFARSTEGDFYACSAAGNVYRSNDAGNSWQEYDNGLITSLTGRAVNCLAVSPQGFLFAGTYSDGIWRLRL